MRWKIYYDRPPDFSSEDGSWEDAPADGVLFVVFWTDGIKHVLSGHDHYFNHDEVIGETDDLGPLLRKLGLVKFGRYTSHRLMEAAATRVREDA